MSSTTESVETEETTTRIEDANAIIKNNMYWAMGGSLIPVPLFDLAYIAGIQLKMLNQFAKLYEIPFSKNMAKSIIASLIGSYGPVSLTYGAVGSLVKLIPGVGQFSAIVTLPVLSGGFTYAVGKVFVQHLESGGTFLDFDPEKVKKHFEEEFKKGKEEATKAKK